MMSICELFSWCEVPGIHGSLLDQRNFAIALDVVVYCHMILHSNELQ